MLENQLISNNKVQRTYLILDKPFNMCIIEYKWSSTKPEYIMEKMIWNTWEETIVNNSLREGKYVLGVF